MVFIFGFFLSLFCNDDDDGPSSSLMFGGGAECRSKVCIFAFDLCI